MSAMSDSALTAEWVTLPVPEFVSWCRWADVGLPFPLDSGELAFRDGPRREEMERILTERKLLDSPALAAAKAVFAAPRVGVYALRSTLSGDEGRYLALAGHDDRAVMVLIESDRAALRPVADTELAASVVAALPPLPALHTPAVEISLDQLVAIDNAIDAGESERSLATQMHQAGLPASLIALRQRVGNERTTAGALGAVSYAAEHLVHSSRSATWREFDEGALLQIERGERQGSKRMVLTPFTPDALFRAAVDAIGSVFEQISAAADADSLGTGPRAPTGGE